MHWLGSPIHAKRGTCLNVRVLDAWIPVSVSNVFESYSILTFTNGASEVQTLQVPHGNRDINYIIEYINNYLKYNFVASYDSARDEVVLSGGAVPTRAGKSEVLGFVDGDSSGPPDQGGLCPGVVESTYVAPDQYFVIRIFNAKIATRGVQDY